MAPIAGVIIKRVEKHSDQRGWLMECFRADEIPADIMPVMSYVSMTNPGIARGPHEHEHQTDIFFFMGSTLFKLYLWDNRKDSATCGQKLVITLPENEPTVAIVPPGVVHAYLNAGDKPGLVLNYPNKLFAGAGKKEKVDEIRHENNAASPFRVGDK
jgi:dTDP-4-dehydrorhamnose 3,5-epimerase